MRNVTYHLGTTTKDGRTYIYTGLGQFPIVEAAIAQCDEIGAIVFERRELWKHGINYGCSGYEPVAVCVARIPPDKPICWPEPVTHHIDCECCNRHPWAP